MIFSLSFLHRSRLLTYGFLFLVAGVSAVLLANGLRSDRLLNLDLSPQAGGATTLSLRSSQAFTVPAPGLTAAEADLHADGDVAFEATFVTAPAAVNPGLGPLFNNASCVACHIKNGRGMPEIGQALVRVSLPESSGVAIKATDGVAPVPKIGAQIQDHAVYGYQPEAAVTLTWREQTGEYPDGAAYTLRSPQVELTSPTSQLSMPDEVLTSLRIPPPVFGTGLLEAIPEQTLQNLADPDDQNQDGISGRLKSRLGV